MLQSQSVLLHNLLKVTKSSGRWNQFHQIEDNPKNEATSTIILFSNRKNKVHLPWQVSNKFGIRDHILNIVK